MSPERYEGMGPAYSPDLDEAAVADRLARGDTLARAILDELQPLCFDEAVNEAERQACFRLRYRAVLEMEMAPGVEFTGGVEHDEFDETAVQIIGRDEARVVATCRLVLPEPGRILPIAAEFGLGARSDVVELGRLVVDPEYRGDGHSVFMGLAARAWLSMRARGFTTVIGATTDRLIALFEVLGFSVVRLASPQTYWGESRQPFLCDGRRSAAGVERWLAAGADDATPAAEAGDGPQ